MELQGSAARAFNICNCADSERMNCAYLFAQPAIVTSELLQRLTFLPLLRFKGRATENRRRYSERITVRNKHQRKPADPGERRRREATSAEQSSASMPAALLVLGVRSLKFPDALEA